VVDEAGYAVLKQPTFGRNCARHSQLHRHVIEIESLIPQCLIDLFSGYDSIVPL